MFFLYASIGRAFKEIVPMNCPLVISSNHIFTSSLSYTSVFFLLLAELLRVIRRLNLKEQWTDLSLHFITLYSLRSTISENTRAQNHFRSIGGLEVLLDGLGLPSSKFSVSKQSFVPSDERYVFHQWQNQTFDVEGSEVWNKEL